MMNKLTMHTLNLVDENIRKLAELFPNAVTERKNGQGQVERAVDFDVLRQELSQVVVEGPQERYQFTWPDKRQSVLLANAPISDTLRPCREESVNFDTTQNLYIEGDNLNVLKLLRETYLGKVKMIYIDPPYNTGNDFVYEDDFREDADAYLDRSGQYDEEGNRLVQNTESNGRFHTDWLNMMYPRLRLAKDLLTEDGVIFISIDDNEQANLKKICDEVFGADNFVAQIVWEKRFTRSNNAKLFASLTDHILVYRKSASLDILKESRSEKNDSIYSNPDNDPRGVWTSVSYVNPASKEQRPNLCYKIKNPVTGQMVEHPTNAWKYSQSTHREHVQDNRLYWGANGENQYPRLKKFLSEMKGGIVPANLWYYRDVGTTDAASKDLEKLIGRGIFDFPKPTGLILKMLDIATEKNSIVLDFFAGSSTTAHAVMQLNAEDGGNRKFIMVQLPEATDKKSEAYKAGYKNICEIGKERIRRAGDAIVAACQPQPLLTTYNFDLASSDYGKKISEVLSDEKPTPDIGFRVLKLDSSNMKDVYYTPAETTQIKMEHLADNIKQDRTPEDLLFQVMLELGVLPSSAITEMRLGGKRVFSVAEGFLLACFDSAINETTITEIAKLKPHYAVFRDSSYANDSVATNFEQIFKAYSPHTVRRVL